MKMSCSSYLSFLMSSCELLFKFSIQIEFDVILNHFKQVDITGAMTIKTKVHEIAYPNMTSICSQVDKVKTKVSQKKKKNQAN